ncbi:hypothetical protein OnM2_091023 [Erysiphe neolycopersici]|uniref:Uncharacterized protein n=1 Tax=Erysiphe neolycopersici TaxID=212602 RepID=A0A420HCX4_9PEZI|nr:hypothetical protein OnM2_091023 [Erysiphe neolycopersici]
MDPTQDMDPFRSDPIAGLELSGGKQFFGQADKSSNNRKRHNSNEISIHLLGTNFIKIAKKYSGDKSQVVNSKIEKASDLFRHYTEKGKLDNRALKRDNAAPVAAKNMLYCDMFTPQITIDTNARDYPSLHSAK